MNKNFFYYASISILAGVCLSLGWYHHYIRHITSLAPATMPVFGPEDKSLEVHVSALTSKESKMLLGHNLPSKGVIPVHFTIQNNSPNEYSLSPDSVNLNHIQAYEVASQIKKTGLSRAIAFNILGFVFWPLIIPGTIDRIHTFHAYNLLKKDYSSKAMKEEIIPVYSVVNRILFISEQDFREEFTVTLIDTKSQEPAVFEISKGDKRIENPNIIPSQNSSSTG